MPNTQTERISVILVDLTGLTLEVVRGILAGAPDIDLVGEVSMSDIAGPADPAGADVAILAGDRTAVTRRAHELLKASPLLRIIAVEHGGRDGWLYELRPHRSHVGELSADALLDAVRMGAVAWT